MNGGRRFLLLKFLILLVNIGRFTGPELGLKYFVNNTTYVYGIAQYEWNLNRGFNSGGFFYGLGLGVRL